MCVCEYISVSFVRVNVMIGSQPVVGIAHFQLLLLAPLFHRPSSSPRLLSDTRVSLLSGCSAGTSALSQPGTDSALIPPRLFIGLTTPVLPSQCVKDLGCYGSQSGTHTHTLLADTPL